MGETGTVLYIGSQSKKRVARSTTDVKALSLVEAVEHKIYLRKVWDKITREKNIWMKVVTDSKTQGNTL